MTLLRALVAALVASAGLVLVTSPPAFACSCVSADTGQFVRWADVVLRGTLVESEPPDQSGTWSSGDLVTYTFEVAEVYEGRVGATVEVGSAVSGASCGLEGMKVGREYLVFAAFSDLWGERTEKLQASLCGGTGGAGAVRVAEVERFTGPAHPPEGEDGEPPTGAPPVSAGAGSPAPEVTESGIWVWGSGVGLLLAVAVATLVVGRRRTA